MKINREKPNAVVLHNLCNDSALTMIGYMKEELELYIDELKPFIKGDKISVYEYTGRDLELAFNVNFGNDLVNIFSIMLDDLQDIGKLAVTLRFERGYRWLDDIVDNLRPDIEEEDE